MSNTRTANSVDVHVGARVRARRLLLGLSQGELGEKLGVTFQQVQKYEKGTNRIGAGRLHQIANVLQVPVAFFFEGAPGGAFSTVKPVGNAGSDPLATLGASKIGMALAVAFNAIVDREVRAAIVALAEAFARKAAAVDAARDRQGPAQLGLAGGELRGNKKQRAA